MACGGQQRPGLQRSAAMSSGRKHVVDDQHLALRERRRAGRPRPLRAASASAQFSASERSSLGRGSWCGQVQQAGAELVLAGGPVLLDEADLLQRAQDAVGGALGQAERGGDLDAARAGRCPTASSRSTAAARSMDCTDPGTCRTLRPGGRSTRRARARYARSASASQRVRTWRASSSAWCSPDGCAGSGGRPRCSHSWRTSIVKRGQRPRQLGHRAPQLAQRDVVVRAVPGPQHRLVAEELQQRLAQLLARHPRRVAGRRQLRQDVGLAPTGARASGSNSVETP